MLTHITRSLYSTAAVVVVSLTSLLLTAIPPAQAAMETAVVSSSGCFSHRLPRNDDGSSAKVSLPFKVNFYQRSYDVLYVNNNGNVTFQDPMATYTPFRITATTPPIIAPFFADVDTRGATSGVTTYGVTSFDGREAFCVNWRHVGYFNSRTDKKNDFQLLIVRTNGSGDFDIVFNYNSVTWETGEASGGSGGLGGTSAGAGYSNGDGNPAHFTELAGSLTPGALLDGGPNSLRGGNNTSPAVPGRYVFHIASGTTVTAGATCKPYYFVSVRGSGEKSSSVDDKNASPKIKPVYDALKTSYESAGGNMANVDFYQVPYQAMSTDVLLQDLDHGTLNQREDQFFGVNVPTYLASVDEGLDQVRGYIDSVERLCARQHRTPSFLLFGYSQGSLVIHRYLRSVTSSDPQWNHIGYVGLIADPGRMPASNDRINWGTAPDSSSGVCQQSVRFLSVDLCNYAANLLPAHFASITDDLCNDGDAVCATSQPAGKPVWQWKASFAAGVQVHGSYAADSHILGQDAVSVAHMH